MVQQIKKNDEWPKLCGAQIGHPRESNDKENIKNSTMPDVGLQRRVAKIGYGDQILGSGLARGFAKKGKRVAFGNQSARQIIWDHHSEEIFSGNPNIAPPGSEQDKDLHWIEFYRGQRIYNWHDRVNNRWVWNYDFKATPGEIFFTPQELSFAEQYGSGFIVIEPNVPEWKTGTINKKWPIERYVSLSGLLQSRGYKVFQPVAPTVRGVLLPYVKPLKVPSFRHALAVLSRAALYIGSEGGLHHGAAAVGIPAVVIFGSWIPPQVTGYASHTNIARGIACGSLVHCPHCRENMLSISVRDVFEPAKQILRKLESCPSN